MLDTKLTKQNEVVQKLLFDNNKGTNQAHFYFCYSWAKHHFLYKLSSSFRWVISNQLISGMIYSSQYLTALGEVRLPLTHCDDKAKCREQVNAKCDIEVDETESISYSLPVPKHGQHTLKLFVTRLRGNFNALPWKKTFL